MEIIVDLCNQHHGSLAELKRMALNAWSAGADVVKVQLMDSEKFFGTKDKKYRDINFETFASLKDFCDVMGISLMATPFDALSFDFDFFRRRMRAKDSSLDLFASLVPGNTASTTSWPVW